MALALATLGQPNPILPNRVAKDATMVSEPSNLAPSVSAALAYGAVEQQHGAEFFLGSVEFDWDPNAPGGVPGFGPPSPPARPLASIKIQQ